MRPPVYTFMESLHPNSERIPSRWKLSNRMTNTGLQFSYNNTLAVKNVNAVCESVSHGYGSLPTVIETKPIDDIRWQGQVAAESGIQNELEAVRDFVIVQNRNIDYGLQALVYPPANHSVRASIPPRKLYAAG